MFPAAGAQTDAVDSEVGTSLTEDVSLAIGGGEEASNLASFRAAVMPNPRAPIDDTSHNQPQNNPSYKPPSPTCRKGRAKQASGPKAACIKRGERVKVKRVDLYHRLSDNQKQLIPKNIPNDYCFFGTVTGGNSKDGWDIKFDILPESDAVVRVMKKSNKVSMVHDGEEEKLLASHGGQEPISSDDEFSERPVKKQKKLSPLQMSILDFCKQDDGTQKKATDYQMPFGRDGCTNQVFDWKILGETEHITESPYDIPMEGPQVNIDFNQPMAKIFFDNVFPDVSGHAKIIDKYLSDQRANFHQTYMNRKMKFHDEKASDPDWKVKQGYLLIIAAANEAETGVENLWKAGPSGGRSNYPDFGQYFGVDRVLRGDRDTPAFSQSSELAALAVDANAHVQSWRKGFLFDMQRQSLVAMKLSFFSLFAS
jgi:hypothetical protein